MTNEIQIASNRRVTSERVVNWYFVKFQGTLLEVGDDERLAVDLYNHLRKKSELEEDVDARNAFSRDEMVALTAVAGIKSVPWAWVEFMPVEGSPEWAKLGKLAPIWDKLSRGTRVAALIMAGIDPK